MSRSKQHGITLIELVIAIVVISMAISTLVGLLALISRGSAEGLARAQSASIANAYLNEIQGKEFSATEDELVDYDGVARTGILDALGRPIAGLEEYRVQIDVRNVALGTAQATAAGDTYRITVEVTDPLGELVRISGFKTRHP